jgi:S1-C subfamily serine protease
MPQVRAAALTAILMLTACGGRETTARTPAAPTPELDRTALSKLSRSTVTLLVLSEGLWGTVTSTREGSGSGFVIEHEDERAVVTAAHVVRGATEILVVDGEGRRAHATEIHAFDDKADVAVLRVPQLSQDIPALALGEQPEVGEEVMLVSSPLGLSTTVAFGTVAAHRPEVRAIQLAAGVSPGSSGGLVADRRGRAVAVIRSKATAEFGGENIAIATPIALVSESLREAETIPLSAPPDRRKMKTYSRHELFSTQRRAPEAGFAGEASVVPVGNRPVEHVCARADDDKVHLAIREVGATDPEGWRHGDGRACASVAGGQKIEVWVGTVNAGHRVELTVARQK